MAPTSCLNTAHGCPQPQSPWQPSCVHENGPMKQALHLAQGLTQHCQRPLSSLLLQVVSFLEATMGRDAFQRAKKATPVPPLSTCLRVNTLAAAPQVIPVSTEHWAASCTAVLPTCTFPAGPQGRVLQTRKNATKSRITAS
jgi:hypothetical protein